MTPKNTSILYMGTPEFAVAPLEALMELKDVSVTAVLTQPDRPAGRGKRLVASPVKVKASEFNIPVLQPTSVRKELSSLTSRLNDLGPFTAGIVCAYGQILPKDLLELPEQGCINIHASILPRWRGAAPIQRAIMAGDTESGISLMKMDQGLDTGPVFSTFPTDINPLETAGELHDKLAALAKHSLKRDLIAILSGQKHAEPQVEQAILYANKITNDECLINWDNQAIEIQRKILGLSPFPGAYSYLGNKRVKIFFAEAKGELCDNKTAPTGEIQMAEGARLEIKCGTGCIRLDRIQLEGKKVLAVDEFLRGNNIKPGMRFQSTPTG